ncbi:MAG: endonuclease NucS [Anaerolineales bacterium]|nr:endonuclease NucS [Anaerolineales bacterium]
MKYWFFTTTNKKADGENITAEEILKQRLADAFWGLGERTPNRRYLQKGDQIVFYLGLPIMGFTASATLASDSFLLSEEQKNKYSHDQKIYETDYGVMLENIKFWETTNFVKDLVPNLKFIENKENWFAYFQGGVRQILEDDYHIITENRKSAVIETIKTEDAIVSASQFALEAHLEEFIDKNWKHINFGVDLVKYEVEEQSGRQFPAGAWSIDFLCVDKANGDFVIIELKRGKSSDSAVGQVLRYIGWVGENLAKPGQKVRGIIISQEVDDALKYAVKGLLNVSVLTYKVDFKLLPFKT